MCSVVCYIQGNLKEYCCHKVDKRIGELLRHRQRLRVRRQLALEKQGVLKDKNGKVVAAMALPTLPTLDFTEDDEDMRMRTERIGRRKSIARFAKSLSKKVKRSDPQSGMDIAANEAGVGLPPMSRTSTSSGIGLMRILMAAITQTPPHLFLGHMTCILRIEDTSDDLQQWTIRMAGAFPSYPTSRSCSRLTVFLDLISQINLAGQAAPFAASYDQPDPQAISPYAQYPEPVSQQAFVPDYYAEQSYPQPGYQSRPQGRTDGTHSDLAYDHSLNTGYETGAVYPEDAGRRGHAVQQHQPRDWAPPDHHLRSRIQPF